MQALVALGSAEPSKDRMWRCLRNATRDSGRITAKMDVKGVGHAGPVPAVLCQSRVGAHLQSSSWYGKAAAGTIWRDASSGHAGAWAHRSKPVSSTGATHSTSPTMPWGARGAKSLAPMPDDFQVISVDEHIARIDGYGKKGFLVNGIEYHSAIICYGSLTFAWHVKNLKEVTKESLAVLDLIKPAPDILVLGSGANFHRFPEELVEHLRKNGTNVDIMATGNASSTFNILNQESRVVACALLPEWDSE